jgi:hypothetical protein
MKKRLFVALAAATVVAIVGVDSASGATEFGSGCAANKSKEGAIWVSTGHSPLSPLPVTAPISGVITEWKVNSDQEAKEGNLAGEFPRIFQQRLLVLKGDGPESFTVVGEAPGGTLNLKGSNTYLTRLPVQQGDYLGLAGDPYALYCETSNEADTFGATVGGTPVGSAFKVTLAKGLQVPVTARVEPDVDGDGYGDETQDKCPQSAAYQTACPTVLVSSLSLSNEKAVTVYVSSSLPAPVAVSGSVKIGKGKAVKLSATSETVAPGTLKRFELTLTKPVRKTLTELSNQKTLKLTIAASATNVAGTVSTATSTLKLRGQRKPAPPKPAHHKAKRNRAKHHKTSHRSA